MRQMTEDNLKAAFAGESQAHLKYTNFAERAEKEGWTEKFRCVAVIHAFARLREDLRLRPEWGQRVREAAGTPPETS